MFSPSIKETANEKLDQKRLTVEKHIFKNWTPHYKIEHVLKENRIIVCTYKN